MADVKLTNVADVTRTYDSIPTTLTSEAIITDLISGLTIVKTADKQNWATGNLTYIEYNFITWRIKNIVHCNSYFYH